MTTTVIHVLHGGPVLMLSAHRQYRFEDHPRIGPVVIDRYGNPSAHQPDEHDLFWLHYDAWVRQGRRTTALGGVSWCDYMTDMQASRRHYAAKRASQGDTP